MTDIRSSFASMHNGDVIQSPKVGKQTIEKMYQKKSQLEHILLRPDTYIGSIETTKESMWVYDTEAKKMIQKEISYVPGLYKIYDEILVNAADNKQRDKLMNSIKIDINAETNTISIWNNGQGIPVVMHKDENMFVPTMIFGHLLTSSNYNDEEQKVTGGRNGYGAKLCNIFSTSFTVETASKKYKKHFKQVWNNNMVKASEPKIKDGYYGEDFTKITFSPDLSKFKMEKLDADIVMLMSRRAFDVAASTRGVSVFLNGEKLPIKNFRDYIDLYIKDFQDDVGNPVKLVYETVNERWEVAVSTSDRGFQQVSFVNSIATTKGGRHVDHVVDMIVKQLIEVLKKKNKGGISIKPFQVKSHMWIFVNCLIVNPTFDSQTKENMTLQAKSFGSKCTLNDKFITSVSKCGIVESVLSWAKYKAQTDLAKTSGKKNSKIRGIPKLEDANEAGTKNSHLCTLILTEGDSAKTLAVSGLGVVGRDYYGVFPLRGKLLNVREATHKQILENAEINNLIKILGLQYKKKYMSIDDLKTLRYGKVMIMTDQDQDGSHIKGLLINFVHTNWPELLRLPFLEEFITPIVKATKKNEELSFYSLPEFEEWKSDTPNSNTYKIKYYKGLGTSTSKEAKEYFQNMLRHRITFKYGGSTDDDNIVMAFARKSVDQRKVWLTNHMEECKRRKELQLPERYLYTKDTKEISYSEFVNLELILFSNADNIRSIPCLVDGFKPGQRKIMFTCFKRNDKNDVKVAQLAGSVAEISAYHHGEVSLCSTIVNLAQNFIGSNNLNLLQPIGQFGTRLTGGKDSASPRYIYTMMSKLARLIFHPHDDPLLEGQYEDNQKIEPVWYIPIIPMVLINGAEGIGTGWSTKIPNHNPRDIINNLRRLIKGDEPKIIHPWYKNFRGSIDFIAEQKYLSNGIVSILSDNKIEITELPIGTWTQNYKENTLEPLLNGNEKVKAILSDYKEYHTDTTVRFVLTFAPGEFDRLYCEEGGFYRVLKLSSSLSLAQMHAFDANNCLRKFESSNEILKEFYQLRLSFYVKRKNYLEGMLTAEAERLTDQARFILEKCEKTLVVENKKRKMMIEELIKRGYRPDPVKEWKRKQNLEEREEVEEPADDEEIEEDSKPTKPKKPIDAEKAFQNLSDVKKFDYLLGMSMWMLTEERKNELLKQRDAKLVELNNLKAKTTEMLWLDDLEALETKLDEVEETERNEELGINKKQAKAMKTQKTATGRNKRASVAPTGDIFPNPRATKVEFVITADILKKHEAALALKASTANSNARKRNVEKSVVKSEPGSADEFDNLVGNAEALTDSFSGDGAVKAVAAVKKEPVVKKEPGAKKETKPRKPREKKADGLKQTKLGFEANKKVPAAKGGAKKTKQLVSDDDDDIISSDSDKSVTIVPVERTVSKRATKKINYALIDGKNDSSSDGSDFDVKEVLSSDAENGHIDANTSTKTVDDIFNSLRNDDDSEVDSPIKPPTKRKLGPKSVTAPKAKRNRKKASFDSDSDDSPIARKTAKKKKPASSDSDFDSS